MASEKWSDEQRAAVATAINKVREANALAKPAKAELKKLTGVSTPAAASKILLADLLGNRDEVQAKLAKADRADDADADE